MRWHLFSLAAVLLLPTAGMAAGNVGSDAMPAQAGSSAELAQATETKSFLVFFDWDKDSLNAEAQQVVAAAADQYLQGGQAQIMATGYTDTSGSADYNLGLSVRRAEAVKAELVRLGVPADAIVTAGEGENDLLVPTGDGVREAQNRRVEIVMQVAGAAPPPPAAEAPPPPPPFKRWAVGLGGWYGWNQRDTDHPNSKESELAGVNLTVDHYVTPNVPISFGHTLYNTMGTAQNDGWGHRSALGAAYQFNELGAWHPYIGAYGGYIFGRGVQDSPIVGPEIGLKVDLTDSFYLYGKGGYDYLFNRNDVDKGILHAGLGGGFRF